MATAAAWSPPTCAGLVSWALIVRQSGGSLLIFENNFPNGNFLDVRLVGKESNRLGIGARLVAKIGGRQLFRDQFPVNSYRSQAPNRVHFGIGSAESVDELIIRWPSGKTQAIQNIRSNQHLVISEE